MTEPVYQGLQNEVNGVIIAPASNILQREPQRVRGARPPVMLDLDINPFASGRNGGSCSSDFIRFNEFGVMLLIRVWQ